MKTYATASIPKYLLYSFSVIRLEEICQENLVVLKAIRYSENQIICKLYGQKEDIKEAITSLYKEINEDCKNKANQIKKIQKKIPDELKEYVLAINDEEAYKESYQKFVNRYIRYCKMNDLKPHPEVLEDFVL